MASTLLSPMVDYYNDEEELDSVDDDDDRSFRGRDSEEGNVMNGLTIKLRLGLLVGKETETRDYCMISSTIWVQSLKRCLHSVRFEIIFITLTASPLPISLVNFNWLF